MSQRNDRGRILTANERYQQALDYIYSFIDYERLPGARDPANYDLRRVDELLARLGNPHLKTKTIHITGSKGKGSTASMIASVLVAAGYKTGLYTSPHLHTFNERIRINSTLISDNDLTNLIERLKPEIADINEKATYGKLTTFEIITALGFLYFAENGLDYQVIEVGLGGRLDATNVVKPQVCVITSISLEHTDVLGKTHAAIAGEKAGIIKRGVTAVTSPQVDEAIQVIRKAAQKAGAKLIEVGSDVKWEALGFDSASQSLRIIGRNKEYKLTIPLLGQYQLENAAAAVAALEVLAETDSKITPEAISAGLAQTSWPGRLQVLNSRPLVVTDGAHNPYSAGKLRDALKRHFKFDKAVLVIGASSDKEIGGILSELLPMFHKVIATHSVHPRAMPTEKLIEEIKKQGREAMATDDVSDAMPLALSLAGEKDLICITGSLFVAAGAIEQAQPLGLKTS